MIPGFFQITLKVFLVSGDKFLILKDAEKQVGDLPGGRFGPGEIYLPWKDSISREMAEELGKNVRYDLSRDPIFLFPHRIVNGGHEALGIAYQARYLGGEIQISDEHDFMQWVDIDSYNPSPMFSDHMLEAVRRFQKAWKNKEISV